MCSECVHVGVCSVYRMNSLIRVDDEGSAVGHTKAIHQHTCKQVVAVGWLLCVSGVFCMQCECVCVRASMWVYGQVVVVSSTQTDTINNTRGSATSSIEPHHDQGNEVI